MRCPTLAELPPPPPGKTGWPWTIESPQLPDAMPNGAPWPRISIVTPSYNQGRFIEETIRSILLQGYPDLEYIIMDGGSADESVSIIKNYERWLTYWQSEQDGGQVEALNRGFEKASGDYLNWLNSDDFLHKNALSFIAKSIELDPNVEVITGFRAECDTGSDTVWIDSAWQKHWGRFDLGLPDFPQDATFLSRSAFESGLPLDERFKYSFDVAFYFYVLQKRRRYVFINYALSSIRVYPEMKTLRQDKYKEVESGLLEKEFVPSELMVKIAVRLMATRLHRFVSYALRLWFHDADRFQVLSFEPVKAQWRLTPIF